MAEKSWYEVGFDGVNREQERIKDSQNQIWLPNRFWLPAKGSSKIVFVDDTPACFREHQYKKDGSFRHWITCLQGVWEDVACCEILGREGQSYVGVLTVIDCNEWIDRKGIKHQYEIRLFPAKLRTLELIRRKKESAIEKGRPGLAGSMYKVTRGDTKSPNCGDDFEFERAVDMEKLVQHASLWGRPYSELLKSSDMKGKIEELFQVSRSGDGQIIPKLYPFNYYKILAPKTPQEVRNTLAFGQVEPSSGAEDVPPATQVDESVPF